MIYKLPNLPYSYSDLEPYIDEQTMKIHHTKHHQGYINNLNMVLRRYPHLRDKDLIDLLKSYDNLPMKEEDKAIFKNNAGGHLNHSLFWKIMSPKKEVNRQLKEEVEKTFGSVERFKKIFSDTATNHFGSGWAWLVKDRRGNLQVYSTPNQDSPYLKGDQPLICLDVWEHAYYLKYQNRRVEYVKNWWNLLKLL